MQPSMQVWMAQVGEAGVVHTTLVAETVEQVSWQLDRACLPRGDTPHSGSLHTGWLAMEALKPFPARRMMPEAHIVLAAKTSAEVNILQPIAGDRQRPTRCH